MTHAKTANPPQAILEKNHYQIKIHSEISQIPAKQWNALVEANHPFIKYEFLHALEKHGCVSEKYGWIPHHIGLYNQNHQLIAALPLYEKHNNYGEFVFDQAWEQAWNSIGLPYYPKLVSTTPYTPVLGQRFLIDETLDLDQQKHVFHQLFTAATEFCEQQNMSGTHFLFTKPQHQAWLNSFSQNSEPNLYIRNDCQFHWHNQNYQKFDDFLAQLKPKKRKNIKQERQAIAKLGITFRVLNGHQATQKDWQDFDFFYQKTFIEKWSTPTLNIGFFKEIGKSLADNIVLVLADYQDECIAGALMFQSDTHLYGRHWGAAKEVKHLHFESCFYQGIEYAIKQGLQVFEPGAGGEHKIARGFSPVKMQSAHWLTVNPFEQGILNFIKQEQQMIEEYVLDCETHSPYKSKEPN
ncbi:GNAT family N-acetyltransferase [Thiomicrorhabdus sp. Kp2]|uniref:GNAT family N-acetyltransferase n=1 Tax=Thiomicrorhabdus sp. Kp2 TaxID=1123518 RepID=UPI000408C3B1|nr:GNAT family N-acetyltransferase [Thiomicrorhabdus sp. Kp2]